MNRVFLSAAWRNLLMANYPVDASVLQPYLPCGTELDAFNGVHYVSLVGFLFEDTRVRGIAFPFHRNFEEVNLRFYVRYKDASGWKRGVVFMKEIVPRRMISLIANKLYGENYATHPMSHQWEKKNGVFHVAYNWKVNGDWNFLRAEASPEPVAIQEGSEAEFITEHYWGYTFINPACTGVYEVQHPKWKVHPVQAYDIHCSAASLYGPAFAEPLSHPPRSVFLAEGSRITVMGGSKIVMAKR